MAKMLHFELMASPEAEWFLRPVDEKAFDDYRDFIATPIDLGTIRRRLELLQCVPLLSLSP